MRRECVLATLYSEQHVILQRRRLGRLRPGDAERLQQLQSEIDACEAPEHPPLFADSLAAELPRLLGLAHDRR